MIDNKIVSVIISAFNEDKTIFNVIEATLQCNYVDEVIVINDGSIDFTLKEIMKFENDNKFIFINFSDNKGKSYAMVSGVEVSKGEIIIFVDADLIGLESFHIEQLLKSFCNNSVGMIIGQPTENKLDEKFNPFQMLSGERIILKKDILPILEELRCAKYGIETLLNLYYKSKGMKVNLIYLWNVYHQIKPKKEGFNTYIKNYSLEALDIIKTLILHHLLVKSFFKRKVYLWTKLWFY